MVSALRGCHATNNIELNSEVKTTALKPFSFVLLGINTPRKNDSSKNDGNIKRNTGRKNVIPESMTLNLNRPELLPMKAAINP
jgi:hypothetical protein